MDKWQVNKIKKSIDEIQDIQENLHIVLNKMSASLYYKEAMQIELLNFNDCFYDMFIIYKDIINLGGLIYYQKKPTFKEIDYDIDSEI